MNLDVLDKINQGKCNCGKEHSFFSEVIIESGAVYKLPQILGRFNARKPFVVADKNTYSAAGNKVCEILSKEDIKPQKFIFDYEHLEPDETNVGLAVMHFDYNSDIIIGVGSGVINDICKIIASVSNKPYIIVGTAPSMDGYASATSSMTMEGLKISLNSKCADVIIGDTDILCNAPIKMMISGLGDMLAKYVSICEWRISNLINGEYYCEEIAALVRSSLKKCVDNADGLLRRDENAVKAVFEGLVIGGVAMKYAGLSRPASGIEHYFSHIWDMRGAEFGADVELHGIQCAVGTLKAIKLYEKIKEIKPDREKALKFAESFDFGEWCKTLREFLGKGAESMIALEEKEKKYDKSAHKERLEKIISCWDGILQIIAEELPKFKEIEQLLQKIGAPITLDEIGIDADIFPTTFKATKDIRDKYILSRLCWDLGIIDNIF